MVVKKAALPKPPNKNKPAAKPKPKAASPSLLLRNSVSMQQELSYEFLCKIVIARFG